MLQGLFDKNVCVTTKYTSCYFVMYVLGKKCKEKYCMLLLLWRRSEKSVVPLTTGVKRKAESDVSCLILVFHDESREDRIRSILEIVNNNPNVWIVRTRETAMTGQDSTRYELSHW